MLTTINDIPPNSTSPLPQSYFQESADSIYGLFAAGLMNEPQVACAPGPSAFSDLAPAGTLFPVVTPNYQYPGLSTAVLAPAAVSPLAAQVYQVQEAMRQGLTDGRSATLTDAVDLQGQAGASMSQCDLSNSAEVFPMSYTVGMVEERNPTPRRKGPPSVTQTPGVAWGVPPLQSPGGGCAGGLSMWAKLFLAVGAGVILFAAINER